MIGFGYRADSETILGQSWRRLRATYRGFTCEKDLPGSDRGFRVRRAEVGP